MKAKPSVLLIDDDATTRKIHSASLAMAGFPTHVVGSAEEALAILEGESIDVVVTDLIMPMYNGVDIISAIRECDYTQNIPIVVFTAGGNLHLIEKAVQAGANEVLQKHTTPPAKLIAKIQELADARKK
jgi:two-component system, chemotaxis family, chemotaxis protein CheY